MKIHLQKFFFIALCSTSLDLSAAFIRGGPLLESSGERITKNIKYYISPLIATGKETPPSESEEKKLESRILESFQYLDERLSLNFIRIKNTEGLKYYEYLPIQLSKEGSFAFPPIVPNEKYRACFKDSIINRLEPTVSLALNASNETIRHEILHALGLGHEQQHANRDNHIDLIKNEVDFLGRSFQNSANEWGINYQKVHGCSVSDFDFDSTMLYHRQWDRMPRKYDSLIPQVNIYNDALNNGRLVRIRALDSTDDARDNLTLNYEDGSNLTQNSIIPKHVNSGALDLRTDAFSSHWRIKKSFNIDENGNQIASNAVNIEGRWEGGISSSGMKPLLSVVQSANGSYEVVMRDPSVLARSDSSTQWIPIVQEKSIIFLSQKILLDNPNADFDQKYQVLDINKNSIRLVGFNDSNLFIDPVELSSNPGIEPSAMDLFAVEVNYARYASFSPYADSSRRISFDENDSLITKKSTGFPAFFRFRYVKDTLPDSTEQSKGYIQIQNHGNGNGHYVYAEPLTGKIKVISGEEGKLLYGDDWHGSQWLIEPSKKQKDGFIIRNRMTNKPLSLSGNNAEGGEDDIWKINFTHLNFTEVES